MSSVLRREATLVAGATTPDSPKLWGQGGWGMAPPKPAAAPAGAPAPQKSPARSAEDLYRFYENISSSGKQELTMSDIAESMTKANMPDEPLKTPSEKEYREEAAAVGGAGDQQQQQQGYRFKLPRITRPKAVVPPNSDGERKGSAQGGTPTTNILDTGRKSNAADTFHEAVSRDSDLIVSPRKSSASQAQSPRDHQSSKTSKTSRASPARSPTFSLGELARASFGELPNLLSASPLNNYHVADSSRVKSPSSLPSPNGRVSSLSSASYPRHRRPAFGDLGEVERRRSDVVSINPSLWMTPLSSPRRSSVGTSPLGNTPRTSVGEAAPDNSHVFGDMLKMRTDPAAATAPRFQSIRLSKLCSNCSSYIFFKTRCLVCGNVYCRYCVKGAMGHMPEGRKCLNTCLGKQIHSRYIREAGNGCFCFVSAAATDAEMRWARQRRTYHDISPVPADTPNSAYVGGTPRSSTASTVNLLPMRSPVRSRGAHESVSFEIREEY